MAQWHHHTSKTTDPTAKRPREPAPAFSLRSFNILADGFKDPFAFYAGSSLPWGTTPKLGSGVAAVPGRRDAVLAALIGPTPLGGPPSVLALQEVQCTTRGWGRFRSVEEDLYAEDGGDHALWLRLKLAKQGYGGAALSVVDDDALDVKPHHDLNKTGETWPCKVGSGPMGGGRLCIALFWREDELRHVGTREVSFCSHFRKLTGGKGEVWKQLAFWNTGLLVMLCHKATGGLLLVGTTHLSPPNGAKGKGEMQQVQFGEALVVEAEEMLRDLGLTTRVPLLLCGDLNALPGSPLHRLLTIGSLPAEEPCLRMVVAQRSPKGEGGEGGGSGVGEGQAGGSSASGGATEQPTPPPLPYSAPTCGTGGPFQSAYATAGGGKEPPFTNFRRVRRKVEVKKGEGGEGVVEEFEEEPPFEGCLDYIMLRNPVGGGSGGEGGPPMVELRLHTVGELPSKESLLASPGGSAPNSQHPSDHFPITACYEVVLGGGGGVGEGGGEGGRPVAH